MLDLLCGIGFLDVLDIASSCQVEAKIPIPAGFVASDVLYAFLSGDLVIGSSKSVLQVLPCVSRNWFYWMEAKTDLKVLSTFVRLTGSQYFRLD